MLIDIDLIHMDGRIRRDYGDIAELAEDIRKNGLINPPVVIPNADGSYTLLAGERRIRAMRQLGYRQVEIRTWRDLDAAARLEVEISENEQRKEFSPRERYEMFQRRYSFLKSSDVHSSARGENVGSNPRGESVGSNPRRPIEQADSLAQASKSTAKPTAYNQAAREAGVSENTIPKIREILKHEGELDPQMIADWDDRKLSTAKLYRELKARTAENDAAIAYQKGVISELTRKLERGEGKGARADAELTKARNAAEEWKRAYEELLRRTQEAAQTARPEACASEPERGANLSAQAQRNAVEHDARETRDQANGAERGAIEEFGAMCERFLRAAQGYKRLAGTKHRAAYAECVRTVMNWAGQAWNEMQEWRKE